MRGARLAAMRAHAKPLTEIPFLPPELIFK